MKRGRLILFLILPVFFLPFPLRAEIIDRLPRSVADSLPTKIRRQWGRRVGISEEFVSLGRDGERQAPHYPWIIRLRDAEARLSESAYLRNIKVLQSLSEGDAVRLKGEWKLLVSQNQFADGGRDKIRDRYFKPCFIVEEVKLKETLAEREATTPLSDRVRLDKEIQEVKLKEARDPAYGPTARRKLAELYRQTGQYEKAIHEYRFGMVLDPRKASAYHRKIGEVYEEMGNEDLARLEFELARLTRDESSSALYRQRLEEWEEAGKYDLLMQEYRFLLQTDPDSRLRYLKKIARLQARIGNRQEADKHYRQLIEYYRGLIEEKPDRALGYHLRIADIYEELGEAEAAGREYETVLEAGGPKASEALVEQADYFADQEQFGRARDLYRRAEELEGADRISIAVKTADLLKEEGKPEEALARLEEAASVGGEEGAKLKLKSARLLTRMKQSEEALKAYEEALPYLAAGERARVHERMGDLLNKLERPDEADLAYIQAVEQLKVELGDEVADENLLERMAKLEEEAGRPEEARKHYEELIVVYSDNLFDDEEKAPRYYRKLGDLYRDLERYDEAAVNYLAWSRIDPSNPRPYYRLSRLYRDQLKDPELAAVYREKYREAMRRGKEEADVEEEEKVED